MLVSLPTPAALQVEFEIAVGIQQRRQTLGDLARQRGSPQIGVEQDARGVQDPAQRHTCAAGQFGTDPARKAAQQLLQPLCAHPRFLLQGAANLIELLPKSQTHEISSV